MLIKELAAVVHQNAVEKGWYDSKKLAMEDFLALIHSEWSEFLEEMRAGKPLVYGMIVEGDEKCVPCFTINYDVIRNRSLKPEGGAVELIDGCLRILDLFGFADIEIDCPDGRHEIDMDELTKVYTLEMDEIPGEDEVGKLATYLHAATSEVMLDGKNEEYDLSYLLVAMSIAFAWIERRGIDPMQVLLLKHEYNKSRPYKHGKKF